MLGKLVELSNKRFDEHYRRINKPKIGNFLYLHFKRKGHTPANILVQPVEKITYIANSTSRFKTIKKHETELKCIQRLQTPYPLVLMTIYIMKSRKENPQKLTQLSSRSHPRHLVGKRTAQKDITIDTTGDSQVNSNFPNKWSPASLTFNNYFYLFLYLCIT